MVTEWSCTSARNTHAGRISGKASKAEQHCMYLGRSSGCSNMRNDHACVEVETLTLQRSLWYEIKVPMEHHILQLN